MKYIFILFFVSNTLGSERKDKNIEQDQAQAVSLRIPALLIVCVAAGGLVFAGVRCLCYKGPMQEGNKHDNTDKTKDVRNAQNLHNRNDKNHCDNLNGEGKNEDKDSAEIGENPKTHDSDSTGKRKVDSSKLNSPMQEQNVRTNDQSNENDDNLNKAREKRKKSNSEDTHTDASDENSQHEAIHEDKAKKQKEVGQDSSSDDPIKNYRARIQDALSSAFQKYPGLLKYQELIHVQNFCKPTNISKEQIHEYIKLAWKNRARIDLTSLFTGLDRYLKGLYNIDEEIKKLSALVKLSPELITVMIDCFECAHKDTDFARKLHENKLILQCATEDELQFLETLYDTQNVAEAEKSLDGLLEKMGIEAKNAQNSFTDIKERLPSMHNSTEIALLLSRMQNQKLKEEAIEYIRTKEYFTGTIFGKQLFNLLINNGETRSRNRFTKIVRLLDWLEISKKK